jgi:hypothetical protein
LPKNDGKIITNLMFSAFCAFRYKIDCRFARSGVLSSCQTAVTPNAKMKPALAERLAALNTEEPMPPAESREDVTPGPAQDPIRNPGLVPSPLSRYSAVSMTP